MINKTLILLSTYNGEIYLEELIESLLKQDNVDILVRDDGSTDSTVKILKKYKNENSNFDYYVGENIGYIKSFWNLINKYDNYKYYALCDQDDIWKNNKIKVAIGKIDEIKENIPVLYTSDVISINNDKRIINTHTFKGKILTSYESLQKSILPGCTFVFNNKAQKKIKQYKGYMDSHDWAIYSIISYFGKVLYDENSYIYYRIHDNNTIGFQNKFQQLLVKIKRFFHKSKCGRSKFARDYYETYKDEFDDEYSESIKELAYYQNQKKLKIKLLFNKKFKGFIFKIYVILNKV